MKKEVLKERIEDLISEIEAIRTTLQIVKNDYVSLDDARKRDYIVRTNYYGNIKDKNVKKDFVEEMQNVFDEDIKTLQDNILNYCFYKNEGLGTLEEKLSGFEVNILATYYRKLKEYEFKQIVLDTYGEKK